VDWRTLIPSIRRVLKQEFRDQVDIESNYQIRVLETADITGDGVPEAVVTLGVVGASSDCVTLVRLDGGRPRVARFRDWKGKVFTVVFPEGASAMHGQVRRFGVLYLIGHGVIKLVLVGALVRRIRPAYPVAIVFLGSFIVYELYRSVLGHSIALLLFAALDTGITTMVVREYLELRRD